MRSLLMAEAGPRSGPAAEMGRIPASHRLPTGERGIETRPPSRSKPRYEAIDVLRGLACVMVVVHHTGFAVVEADALGAGTEPWLRRAVVSVMHMAIGTPMFFVISGYCVLASMDAIRRRGT